MSVNVELIDLGNVYFETKEGYFQPYVSDSPVVHGFPWWGY